jgi:cobalt-zinc-cadmium efflux system protein
LFDIEYDDLMKFKQNHSYPPESHNRTFAFGIALNLIYIIVESVFGILINSTALIADAGHNFGDVLGLLLAWGAAYLAKSPASSSRTYGMRKATIMAAFLNGLILLIAVGAIAVEAVKKIIQPEAVGGTTMMIVAGVGVIVNSATAILFVKGKEKDLNIRGAFLHMAADAAVSLGVVLAGLFINLTGFSLIDPLMSLAIVAIIAVGTARLLKDSFQLSMDAVPKFIPFAKVKDFLCSLEGVQEVHDLHIWAMSTTEIALTAHLVMTKEFYVKDDKFLSRISYELHDRFGIDHPTIQIEQGTRGESCSKAHV